VKVRRSLALAVATIFLTGCAGRTAVAPTARSLPPTDAQRAQFGSVGVAAAGPDRTVEIEISGRPLSRAKATLVGAGWGLSCRSPVEQ
jgi:hypothetical protein